MEIPDARMGGFLYSNIPRCERDSALRKPATAMLDDATSYRAATSAVPETSKRNFEQQAQDLYHAQWTPRLCPDAVV
jgi:hypothetical protein